MKKKTPLEGIVNPIKKATLIIYYILITFVFSSSILLSFAHAEVATLGLRVTMPKTASISIRRTDSNFSIISSNMSKQIHSFPHAISIYVTYNGASTMKVILTQQDNENANNSSYFFKNTNDGSSFICHLINADTGNSIPKDGTIFEYKYDQSYPMVGKEIKLGMDILTTTKSVSSGKYVCQLTAIIVEGG